MSRTPDGQDPFRLRAAEALPAAVERIARDEIEAILAHLARGTRSRKAVHEVRKATKRLRALVRLFRDQLGERRYRQENRALRDAARMVSPLRDAAVLVATADRIAARFGDQARPRIVARVRAAARARLRAPGAGNGARPAVRRAGRLVRAIRAHIPRWRVRGDGWSTVRGGLRRIYRRGRAAWKAAEADPTVESLHEWRKRVKDLRYALDLLEPLWPAVMRAFAKQVDELGDRLGEDHDLAVLRRLVVEVTAPPGTPDAGNGDRETVLAVIDGARDELQAGAWPLAARIYEEKAGRFVRRLATYWDVWREEAGGIDGSGSDR